MIPQVRPIIGPEAVRPGAHENSLRPDSQLPRFTMMWTTRFGINKGSRRRLMLHRREIADALAALAVRGVEILIFSDNAADVTLDRVIRPLHELMHTIPRL